MGKVFGKLGLTRAGVAVLTVVGLVAAASAVAASVGSAGASDLGVTVHVGVQAGTGADPSASSTRPSISGDGFWVTFESQAKNLVPNDFRAFGTDVFLVDRRNPAGTIQRVSVDAATGGDANNDSTYTTVSQDGTKVLFASTATDLIIGQTTHPGGVYLRDMTMSPSTPGAVQEVDVSSTGRAGNKSAARSYLSGDARYAAFQSQATNLIPGVTMGTNNKIFVRDLVAGVTKLVSVTAAGAPSAAENVRPEMSTDGSEIAWESLGSDFGPTDTNNRWDIYATANPFLSASPIQLVSQNLAGTNSANLGSGRPSLSGNGRYAGFQSTAVNLTADPVAQAVPNVYVRDLVNHTTTLISVRYDGTMTSLTSTRITFNFDGSVVAFVSGDHKIVSDDTNGTSDNFLKHWQASPTTVTRISVSSTGGDGGCPSPPPPTTTTSPTSTTTSTTTLSTTTTSTTPPTTTTSTTSLNKRPPLEDISTRPFLSNDASVVVFISSFCNLVPGVVNDGTRQDVYVRVYPPSTPTSKR
jgi:hypothetical protein